MTEVTQTVATSKLSSLLALAAELWEGIKCEFYREELRDLSEWVSKHPDTWMEHAKLKAFGRSTPEHIALYD